MPQNWSHRGNAPAALPPAAAAFRGSSPDAAPWHRGLDPYFRWAQRTQWRGFTAHAGWDRVDASQAQIHIIARARDEAMLQGALLSGWLMVPAVYHRKVPGTDYRALHFSARVHRSDEALLLNNPLGLRWELALPLRDAERTAVGSAVGVYGPQRSLEAFRAKHVAKDAVEAAQPLGHPQGLGHTLAVIDFGCPFLHRRLGEPATRVAAVWDQGSDVPGPEDPRHGPGWPWLRPSGFGYGRELGPEAVGALAAAVGGNAESDEAAIYRGIDYLIDYDDPRRRLWYATHGGHVLDIAGGTVDPLAGATNDHASTASLVFVQLPSMTAADASGGSLAPHLLDGVRYALDVCSPSSPLAVSISYGSYAGPHDGSSLIESALDELLQLRPKNFAVVLAAGNAREARSHAQRDVRRDRSALLRCCLAPGDTTDTFVEIWYHAPPPGACVQVRVRPPNRVWSSWVRAGQEDVLRDDGQARDVIAMLRHDAHVPNGDPSLILLAVAPSAQPADIDGALAEPGVWEIEIELVESDPTGPEPIVRLQAWIERDDPGLLQDGVRSYLLDQLADDEYNTLSSLATGRHTIVAGGFNIATGQEAPYSSTGPQRQSTQDLMVLAACEDDEVTPSVAAAASRSAEVFRMNGTSVAAPVLARRLLNRMMKSPVLRKAWPAVLRRLAGAGASKDPFLKAMPPRD